MPLELFAALQLAVGFVFLLSGAAKLRRPAAFFSALTKYQMLPAGWERPAGIALIAVELGIAVAHLTGYSLPLAALLTLPVLGVFLFVVVRALGRSVVAPCMCFGSDPEDTVSSRTVIRIGVLAAAEVMLCYGLFAARAASMLDGLQADELFGAGVCAALALLLTSWALATTDIREIWRIEGPADAPESAERSTG